jgi:ferredoxin
MKTLILILVLAGVLFSIGCERVANPEYNVESAACISCDRCVEVCPVDAIEYTSDGKAFIDQTKCTQCGKCLLVCPKDAIY